MVLKVLKLYAIIQGDTPWSRPTFKGREEDWEALKETEKKSRKKTGERGVTNHLLQNLD